MKILKIIVIFRTRQTSEIFFLKNYFPDEKHFTPKQIKLKKNL
jgi:hypothetical protein